MRIARIEIDGFGRFHDAGWVLDEGLTVLVGANEAGKSTLLNALRALLFGFEPTRDGRAWYPPLAGGRRGGRLALVTASGERWTVERHGEKGGGGTLAVRAPNGNQGGQETLSRLLHGADRDLFNNIFAFGLGELQSFSSLSADGVRGRIYGAGAGLGGTSAVELERRLRQQQDATFLVRGSQKPLNALLGQLESTRAEIAELSRQPAEHEAAHRERVELEERASALRVEIRAAREREIRLENLQRAAPIAAELATIEGELAAGDASLDTLPTDAVTELGRRAAEASQASAVVRTIDERLEADRSERAALVVDGALLGAADEILALRDATAAGAGLTERRRDHVAAEMRHQATVAEQLARTGIVDEGGLVALDDSIAAVEDTRSLEQGLVGARAAAASAEESRRSAAAELAARQREVAGGEEASEERMEERAAALEGLDALRIRGAVAESRIASSGARLASGATRLVGLGLVVAGLAAGFALGQLLLGALVGAVLGALVTVVVAPRAGGSGNELDAVDAERRELLARAGLPPDASDERVRALATQIATARARAALAEDHRASLAARQAELERRDHDAVAASDALHATTAAWDAWLAGRSLPSGLSPDGARQVLTAAGAARRAAAERDEQRALIAAIDRDGEALAARVDALLDSLAAPRPSDAARRDAALAGLLDRLERARSDDRRAQELDTGIALQVSRREPAQALLAEREAAVAAHLAALGCADADLLRRRDAAAGERRALQSQARELRASLALTAGGPDAVDALVAETHTAAAPAIEAERAETAEQLERLESEERETMSRIGALADRIRQLEAAEELGQRRQELAILEGRAAATARAWAVRAITLKLLEETRSRYERERQPDVLRAAEAHFARVTDGRYARIVAAPGDATVRVETEGGTGRITDELSRGTAEQLYLALRFGLIEEFARTAEPLPVVMDDILVNFDAARADRAAAAIRDLAGRHQVLYFTCHPPTAELLDPTGARTVTLEATATIGRPDA